MAKHSITIINKGSSSGDGTKKLSYTKPKTAGTQKKTNAGVSNRNRTRFSVNTPNILQRSKAAAAGIASAYGLLKLAQKGVNIYATINAAATGEELRNANLKTMTRASVDPIGFGKDVLVETFLSNLRTQRFNQTLEYQRQLTGNLVYSKSFKNGTF